MSNIGGGVAGEDSVIHDLREEKGQIYMAGLVTSRVVVRTTRRRDNDFQVFKAIRTLLALFYMRHLGYLWLELVPMGYIGLYWSIFGLLIYSPVYICHLFFYVSSHAYCKS
ncbi:hypothetical protein F4813DRAFT_341116 [Daldinia decipiens]|uniref:uncharacterized protein n=1 Tax=Daldinia decipiens TaxID=326647 RepID=UPI0020C28CF7|nr:uncharacterized protein F4813DRAFT_341116 [Daldinia decipiens]KAI1662564.1 hypothetical protein F4813DRAFT_341116 [Daldinia decipiens]